MLSNWRNRPRPIAKSMEQGRSYNRQTGKVADGETVSDGLVVAENRSNVRGAREPCCNARPVAVGEAGANDKTPGKLQDPRSGGYTARGRWRRADQGGVGRYWRTRQDRKHSRLKTSHKLCREAGRRAECGKSACSVRRGGGWKRVYGSASLNFHG